MKVSPIIAVKNVKESSIWYQTVLGCKSKHGGNVFDVLVSEENEILICLHKWGEHEHPTLENPAITPGNGLLLYFRTEFMEEIRQNLKKMDYKLEREIQVNPNSGKKEFSVIDPNGYYLTFSESHNF